MSDLDNESEFQPSTADDAHASRTPSYPTIAPTSHSTVGPTTYPTTAPTMPASPDYGPRTNSFAITSFVLAFFATIISIVFGHIALSQIKRTGEKGRGLALAGLWISYLQIVAAVVTIGIIFGISISAQNAYKNSVSLGNSYSNGTQNYTPVPPAAAADPATADATYPDYSQPTAAPDATGPASVPLPATSVPASDADKAYCQNRGVLLWLTQSSTFRGALCSINGAPTLISISTQLGGSVFLPATAESDSYTATAHDGTVYTYNQDTITVATPSQTFQEPTSLWEPGTSSTLTLPGDLGLSTPITYPSCDNSVIVVYGTSWDPATNSSEVQKLLTEHPGSSYIRTDLSCQSLVGPSTANSGGNFVYSVYSPSTDIPTACKQVAGTKDYARLLTNDKASGDDAVTC